MRRFGLNGGQWVRSPAACLLALGVVLFPLVALADSPLADPAGDELQDFAEADLSSLMKMEVDVSSVARKSQKLANTASAVFVISHEDIQRSGATHLAEVLRLVPGLQVARLGSSGWAVSSRGFNQRFADKLLVMLDGVIVYSPLFNGVSWEALEINLDDIERIEVVRGPGAALWGSNALNGVIHIITKHAVDTRGAQIKSLAGTSDHAQAHLRYGGKVGESTHARASFSFANRGSADLVDGQAAGDGWRSFGGESRLDSQLSSEDALTLTARAFSHDTTVRTAIPALDPPYVDTTSFSGSRNFRGGSLGATLIHRFSEDSEAKLDSSYQYSEITDLILPLREQRFQIDAQHYFNLAPSFQLMNGLGYRRYQDSTDGNFVERFDPESRGLNYFTGFVHADWEMLPETLHLIGGTKLEHTGSTGAEFDPTVSVLYTPTKSSTLWFSFSRAARAPARSFEDTKIPVAAVPIEGLREPALVTVFGSRDLASEVLYSYELGFRSQVTPALFFDLTGFYNEHEHVLSLEPGSPGLGSFDGVDHPVVVVPLTFGSQLKAYSTGIEATVDWRPVRWWRLAGNYTYLNLWLSNRESQDTVNTALYSGNSPRNSAYLRSMIDLSSNIRFDLNFRLVDKLVYNDVDGYAELDARLAWSPRRNLEIALVGQNLLHDRHQENVTPLFGVPPTAISRAGYLQVRYAF